MKDVSISVCVHVDEAGQVKAERQNGDGIIVLEFTGSGYPSGCVFLGDEAADAVIGALAKIRGGES